MTATDQPAASTDRRIPSISLLGTLLRQINGWFDRSLQYTALAELDNDRLKDIGLTQEDIRRVRARGFR